MYEFEKCRIYGKALKRFKSEDIRGRAVTIITEYAYREYRTATGDLAGIGSEDFSPIRENTEMIGAWVWTWDGVRRNKGGKRWFEYQEFIRFRKSDRAAVRRYLKTKYPLAAAIQLRK